jgi:pilus assembly protein TadC
MPRLRSHIKKDDGRKQVAEATKRKIILLISFLLAISLFLGFRVGESIWPVWIIEYRKPIMAFLLFFMFAMIFGFPIIIEANSNPRKTSGPGKDPRQGWDP